MKILGDRHYIADPGETITFKSSGQTGVGSIAVSGASSNRLPATVTGGGHHVIAITATFTGDDGGRVGLDITGQTGSDSSTLRQLTGLPIRTGVFFFD